MGQPPAPAPSELTSLDERLGLLLIVRISFVVLVVMAALFAPGPARLGAVGAAPLSAAYMVVAGLVETYRRSSLPARMFVHRAVLPLDAVYLVAVVTGSGGPASPFMPLFAVQLIAVTLLASERTGLRMALWDTFLLVAVSALGLWSRVAALVGGTAPRHQAAGQTALAVAGFWVVAVCTALFASVSERELRRGKAEMRALAEMASALEGLADEEEILGVLLSTLVAAFPVKRGALWHTRASRPVGLSVAAPGAAATAVNVASPAAADQVALDAWAGREPRLVRRLSPEQNPVAARLLPGAVNVVVLPLSVEGTDSGLVLLEHGGHPMSARLPRRTLVMMVQFTGHAALAVRNARLLSEQERLAAIDGLTGLANRREFDTVLAREVSRAERSGEPLSLVVFDVDHFKAINDSRGHLGGDEVLRGVAAVLAGAVRDMDLVARYGGEEFAVVLPRCDQHDAIRVVERVTATLRARTDLAGVTMSSGVATLPFNASGGHSLVQAADEALYESKRAGRDRYSVSARRSPVGPSVGAC